MTIIDIFNPFSYKSTEHAILLAESTYNRQQPIPNADLQDASLSGAVDLLDKRSVFFSREVSCPTDKTTLILNNQEGKT